MGKQMNSGGNIASIIVDLDRSIKLISVCVVIITVSTMLYVWVLKWIAKPLLYTSLSLILLGLIAGGGFMFIKAGDYPVTSE
jgi:uncharacterized membrane protein YjdF